MILHIVRKDVSQLWMLVTIALIAQLANTGLWFALDHFQKPAELVVPAQVFPFIAWIAIIVLIVACVHQDVVPGVSQDWLIRPIRRADLILAKVMFVLIFVNAPMFVSDLAHGMARGFGVRQSLAAAGAHGLLAFLALELPILTLATITTSVTQVIGGVLAIWLSILAIVLAGTAIRGGAPPPFALSGMQWMTPAFWTLLALVAACIIIPLQYFRRATSASRRIAFTATILAPMLSFSSWNKAFGFQQSLSADPKVASLVKLSFNPEPAGVSPPATASSSNRLLLPIVVSGLPPESLLLCDRADIRLAGQDGTALYSGRTGAPG